MKQKVKILLTCMGGSLMPLVTKHLKEQSSYDLDIVGVNASSDVDKSHLDAFYEVPLGGDSQYSKVLLDIAQKEKVEVLIPCSDEEAFELARNKELFERSGIKVLVSSQQILEKICDKLVTYETLEQHGLKVPDYRVVDNMVDLKEVLEYYGFPQRSVICKPASGRGGRGLYVFKGLEESLPGWLGGGLREERVDELDSSFDFKDCVTGKTLVMPALKAPCYDVDVLSFKGKTYSTVIRQRVNPAGIPFAGNTIVNNQEMIDYCEKAAAVLGLDSLHDFDFMTDENGEFALLEVNPRPSGSIMASLFQKYPLIDQAIEFLINDKVTKKATNGLLGKISFNNGVLERVCEEVFIRAAVDEDLEVTYSWQKEQGTRTYFRNPEIPGYDEHCRWFLEKIKDLSEYQIIMYKEMPVGSLRLDKLSEENNFEISIVVSSEFRGRGIGRKVLELIRHKYPQRTFVAEIHSDNLSSKRIFRAIGYVAQGDIYISQGRKHEK